MRKTCWTPRRDHLVCPLCEVGELLPPGQGSARCNSCATFVSGTMLEGLQCIVALASSLGNHACEECGYLEIRHLIGGVFYCPGCGSEVLPLNTSSVARKPVLELGGHVQQRRGGGTGRAYAIRRVGLALLVLVGIG
jgi:ribosomal protein L37AE/L43A